MPLKIALVEDEPLSRRRLIFLLKEAGCEIVGEFDEGNSLLAWLRTNPAVDGLFLDVQMPGINGFDLIEEVTQPLPIVFVTGHIEYRNFDFGPQVVEYLVKPIFSDNVAGAVSKIRQYIARHTERVQEKGNEELAAVRR